MYMLQYSPWSEFVVLAAAAALVCCLLLGNVSPHPVNKTDVNVHELIRHAEEKGPLTEASTRASTSGANKTPEQTTHGV